MKMLRDGRNAILRAAPMKLDSWLIHPPNRLRFARLPTPVQRAPWLDHNDVTLWIKHDELSSDLYGGGKVRKLEWILANEPYQGDLPIVSIGAIGSHHLLALALYLRTLKRSLHALTFEQVLTPHVVQNLAALVSLGTQIWHVRQRARLPWALLNYYTWARPVKLGQYLQPGASTAVGGLGFVVAGLELAEQIQRGQLPQPKTIYMAMGTAGSAAGLALGLALARVATHLRWVCVAERIFCNKLLFHHKLHEVWTYLRRCGLQTEAVHVDELLQQAGITWSLDHSQVGAGYGVPTMASQRAVDLANEHGLKLETTYTGKCLAAIQQDLQTKHIHGPVLFWNTHGSTSIRSWIVDGWEERLPPSLRAKMPIHRQPGE